MYFTGHAPSVVSVSTVDRSLRILFLILILIPLTLSLSHKLLNVFQVLRITELHVSSENVHHQILKLYSSYCTSSMHITAACTARLILSVINGQATIK